MTTNNDLEKLKQILPDNLFDSKDWRSGGIVERVEWLLSMYEATKSEVEMLWNWRDEGDR